MTRSVEMLHISDKVEVETIQVNMHTDLTSGFSGRSLIVFSSSSDGAQKNA